MPQQYRLQALNRFYTALNTLESKFGDKRLLKNCHGRMRWPNRGVYFFFENGEIRINSAKLRVVRVGTHAVSHGSKTTLWNRLRTHRGRLSGRHKNGGNHRGSIFRLHVGTAILNRDDRRPDYPTWASGQTAPRTTRDYEHPVEKLVSRHIRNMPFLWLEVDDKPRKTSMRAYIEQNTIALLSNYNWLGTPHAIDPPSNHWLGNYCENPFVRQSGLWNVRHVDQPTWDASFLDKLEDFIESI